MFDGIVLATVFGLERDLLITGASAAGGVVVLLSVLAMVGLALAPAFSSAWDERLGGTPGTIEAPEDAVEGTPTH